MVEESCRWADGKANGVVGRRDVRESVYEELGVVCYCEMFIAEQWKIYFQYEYYLLDQTCFR